MVRLSDRELEQAVSDHLSFRVTVARAAAAQLAHELDVSPAYLSQIETEQKSLPITLRKRLEQ